jgi:hypothetical protein
VWRGVTVRGRRLKGAKVKANPTACPVELGMCWGTEKKRDGYDGE